MSQQPENDRTPDSKRNILHSLRDIVLHPFLFFDSMPLNGGLLEPVIWCAVIFLVPAAEQFYESHNIYKALQVWSLAVLLQPLLVLAIWKICRLFKGSGSYIDTFRVQAYSNLVYVISWIPWISFIVWSYKIVLLAIGLCRAHRLPLDKAFIAAIVGTLSVIILIITVASAVALYVWHKLQQPHITFP